MISKRTREMTSFIVMDVLEKANALERNGVEVIHLEVGEPDFNTPRCVIDAMTGALENGHTHYTHSLGLFELREAISRYYEDTYSVAISPEQIIVTSGTSPAMFLLFSVLLEQNDEVIISDPHYACYPNFIKFANGTPVTIPIHPEDGFQYKPELIKEKLTSRTKGIFINSPSNPTGNLLSESRIKKIARLAGNDRPPYIISDEIYHGLVYEGTAHSILEYTKNAFVLNGFSKLFAMTGLRLGYLIAPEKFVRPIQKVQQNFFISANAAVQIAGIAALADAADDVDQMKQTYDKRRQYMISRLKSMGFGIAVEPTGAFYVFADASHLDQNSYRLAFDILEKAHVGVTPGIDFGQMGEGFLRFSYANSIENIKKGMDRIETYIKNHSR